MVGGLKETNDHMDAVPEWKGVMWNECGEVTIRIVILLVMIACSVRCGMEERDGIGANKKGSSDIFDMINSGVEGVN